MDQRQDGAKAVSAARTNQSGTGSFVGGSDLQHSTVDPAELADEVGVGQQLNPKGKSEPAAWKQRLLVETSVTGLEARVLPLSPKN